MDINKKEFAKLLSVNANNFGEHYTNKYFKRFFEIDELVYYKKVLEYYDEYIEKLDLFYDLNLRDNFKQIELRNKVSNLLNKLTRSKINVPKEIYKNSYKGKKKLCDALEKHGFDIKQLFKLQRYAHFMPQYMALVLIYFYKQEEAIKSVTSLSLTRLYRALNLSKRRIYTLFDLFKFTVKKIENIELKGMIHYPRDNFIKDLEELLEKSYNIDVDLILKLFSRLKFTPEEFTKRIVDFKGITGGHNLLYVLKTRVISNIIYNRIRNNYLKLQKEGAITQLESKKALSILDKAIRVKSISLIHGGITYNFKINEKNLGDITNEELKIKLSRYLSKISKGEYPKHLFDDSRTPSGSMLYLKGTRKENLQIKTIKKVLIANLTEQKKIKKHGTDCFFNLSAMARKTYFKYKEKNGIKPNHDPILSALVKRNNIIAIETPVWKSGKNVFTGHIDLLGVINNKLIVADYKPNENDIFRAIPQISAYAYMIKERLGLKDFKNVLCVGFNKDACYSFKPDILENETLEFISELNLKREVPLYCIKKKGNVEMELSQAVKNLIL